MYELGLQPCNSFSGNICFKFSVLCLCSVVLHLGIEKYHYMPWHQASESASDVPSCVHCTATARQTVILCWSSLPNYILSGPPCANPLIICLNKAETEIDCMEDDEKIKTQTDIDRHGLKPSSNICQPPRPPHIFHCTLPLTSNLYLDSTYI